MAWKLPRFALGGLRTRIGLASAYLLGAFPLLAAQNGEPAPWPFNPRAAVTPPAWLGENRPHNDIDAFILERLHQEALQPAPPADRRILARRLYFDLIGLPPSPEEMDSFLQDNSPKAYETLVDSLLADERYGEHWARKWLDLARYADTAGYEGDPDLPHAWRYRDYVIDSFNQDKPFDLFIREQIAGDEFKEIMGAGDLPTPDAERTVALTFLRLAPFTEPRGDQTRHEMLSEMTSTVSSVFLGLTVGCAQCHDHKYDPIPTKDFYRLKAFFSTVWLKRPEPGDIYQIGGPLPAKFYREGEEEWAEQQRNAVRAAIASDKSAFESLKAELESRVPQPQTGLGIQSLGAKLGNNYVLEKANKSDGKSHFSIINADGESWSIFDSAEPEAPQITVSGSNAGHWFGDLPNPTHISIGQNTDGTPDPKGNAFHGDIAEVLIYDHPLTRSERVQVATYFKSKEKPPGSEGQSPPLIGLSFWLDASDPDNDPATPSPTGVSKLFHWRDKVAGILLQQADPALQPIIGVLDGGSLPTVRFQDDFLTAQADDAAFLRHQQGAIVVAYSVAGRAEGYGFTVGGNGAFVSTVTNPSKAEGSNLQDVLADEGASIITDDERRRYQYLAQAERFHRQQLKRLEPMAMSLRHSYGPPFEPGTPVSRVMIRGEYDNPGEVVEAGFPTCITGSDSPAPIRLDPFKRWPTRSRRMALANWIASPENPLTARVIANRLWHWHFGQGIVKTPSDFGQLSGGASHPELLDWLANELVANEWRLKHLHRLIVTSATYRQASQSDAPGAAERDPENRLWWHFPPRRLEAEAIRDAVLAISGRLNLERFGPPIFPALPGGIEDQVKYDRNKWATDRSKRARKRSIYVYQQRTLSMPFMQNFDALVCEDTRPVRRTSTTPLQALTLFNGELVNEEAQYFAKRIANEGGETTDTRIHWAFQCALGRPPTPEELATLQPFATTEQLPRLARILFNTNEFVYLD